MNSLVIALGIGVIAGVIDVVPMIIQKLEKSACISAFAHWIALGLIIPFVNWDLPPWLKGLLVAELATLPVMIIVFPKDRKALIPISAFSAILGVGVGMTGSIFIG